LQPLDYLISKFFDLYFSVVDIPDHLTETVNTKLGFISSDGTTTSPYILLLAETCQDIKRLTGWEMREVIGNSLLYMWPRVFDRWLEKPDGSKVDCKWVDMGGAEKFYKDFLPAYLARNESCNRQVAATDDEIIGIFLEEFLVPVIESLKKRFADDKPAWPGDVIEEIRIVEKRGCHEQVFLWILGTTPATFTGFQDVYKVRKSIGNYTAAIAKLDGGPHSAKTVSGKSVRGHSVKLDLLPVDLIKELANLLAWEKVDPALKAMFVRLGVRLRVPNAPEDGAEDSGLVSGGGGATHASDSDFGEEAIDDDTTLSEKATQLPSTSSQNVMATESSINTDEADHSDGNAKTGGDRRRQEETGGERQEETKSKRKRPDRDGREKYDMRKK